MKRTYTKATCYGVTLKLPPKLSGLQLNTVKVGSHSSGSVSSLTLWLFAVSVDIRVEPKEATVRALLNTAAIMGNARGVIFWGVTVGVPWVVQLGDFSGISQSWREIQFCKAIPARSSDQPGPLSFSLSFSLSHFSCRSTNCSLYFSSFPFTNS